MYYPFRTVKVPALVEVIIVLILTLLVKRYRIGILLLYDDSGILFEGWLADEFVLVIDKENSV